MTDVARAGNLSVEHCHDVNVSLSVNGALCSRCEEELQNTQSSGQRQQQQQQRVDAALPNNNNREPTLKSLKNSTIVNENGSDVLQLVIHDTLKNGGHCLFARTFLGHCMDRLPAELLELGVADRFLVRSRLAQRIFKIREAIRAERRRERSRERQCEIGVAGENDNDGLVEVPVHEMGQLHLRLFARLENSEKSSSG